jgi:16S rRNA (cytosine967-C5)-methyltransferase
VLDSAAFRSGACLIQDEASQLVAELVGAGEGHWVLDACAAPGGKTVALAARVGARGGVVACDVRRRRLDVLRDTLTRTAVPRVWAVHIPLEGPLPFPDGTFDRVLVDAPCSGLGTLRRDPDIKWKRQAADLEMLAAAQGRLLDRVAPLVRHGGRLVYSTCSSEPEENEGVVRRFLEAHPDFRVCRVDTLSAAAFPLEPFATAEGYWRTFPPRDQLDAFFGAVLERVAAAEL